MPTLKEYFMVDKVVRVANMIKRIGGLRAALKQRYLTDDNRAGEFVGEDQFGNRYFQENTYFMPRNRYVIYSERVWLDYDASQIPAEWHGWLHHICDDPPTVKPPVRHKWMMQHRENNSLVLGEKYVPYSTTRPKIQGWVPGQGKASEV